MRILPRIALAVLLLVLQPAPALFAGEFTRSAAQSATLDGHFADLAAASSEAEARRVADSIWRLWITPEDPVLAARVEAIITGGGFAGPSSQLPLIDALVADYPDFAEGWNLRATAHFMRGDYDAALGDIDETLRREPRHFGALAGRALIFHTQGRTDEALEAIKQALDIHPFLPERSLFPELGPAPLRS